MGGINVLKVPIKAGINDAQKRTIDVSSGLFKAHHMSIAGGETFRKFLTDVGYVQLSANRYGFQKAPVAEPATKEGEPAGIIAEVAPVEENEEAAPANTFSGNLEVLETVFKLLDGIKK